jgi:AP-3 complex subunit beta
MGDAKYCTEKAGGKQADIKALLDNSADGKKLEGMKRLIAMISQGTDAAVYFPDVVKNVIVQNLEVSLATRRTLT